MMSSEIETYLTGRYISFRIFTLSFAEYLDFKKEYDRLLEIRDNYPKYLLTTDSFAGGIYEGIKTMHIAEFLLSEEF